MGSEVWAFCIGMGWDGEGIEGGSRGLEIEWDSREMLEIGWNGREAPDAERLSVEGVDSKISRSTVSKLWKCFTYAEC